MKRLLAALLTLFALLILSGCGSSSSDGPHLLLYYPAPSGGSPGGDGIVSRSVDWAANSTLPAEQQVRRVVSLLLEDSADDSLESPIPASTRLLACQVADGAAWVDFSDAYGQLSGMELTIADYCVTLSLSQIVGIYSVRITVNGTELAYRDSNIFLAGDVLMTSQDDVVQNLSLWLYFPDRETGELTAEERLLTVYEGESQAEVILSALKAGPESESLSPLLPTGFAVLTVRTEGGICYLNLPKGDQYLMPEDETEQQRMVQGLVNSLCSARGVRQIQLLLDGEVASSLGSVDISQPFSPIR